jgi:protein-S-isoprenylcysteine O-methyltransferase Ste14
MMETLAIIHETALAVVFAGALGRTVLVVLGWGRTLHRRRDFKFVRFAMIEAINLPEPFLLGVFALLLYNQPLAEPGNAMRMLAALCGGALSVAGWVAIIAAFFAWPGLFAGHAIPEGHRLRTDGVFALVRHPSYAGAILIWAGLAVGYLHPLVCAIALVYVVPCYLVYIRSEEEMMRREFGPSYDAYRRSVPMLLPRLWRSYRLPRPADDDGGAT